jgi:hypothetical protein
MYDTAKKERLRRALVLFGCCLLVLTGTLAYAANRNGADAVGEHPVPGGLEDVFAPVQYNTPVLSPDYDPAPAASEPKAYILRTQDGVIAIFRDGDTVPQVLTGIVVETLPIYDQEQLTYGIRVESAQEMIQLLEDFGS